MTTHIRRTTQPPQAKRQPTTTQWHGQTLVDDYAWLRADNWQEVMRQPELLAADIHDYLVAENAWTDAQMAATQELQQQLVAEKRGRIAEQDASVPQPDGPWRYYTRFREGGQHPIFCRVPRDAAAANTDTNAEEILLDGDTLAANHDYFSLGEIEHSPNHQLLAYAVDTQGNELYSLKIIDLASGKLIQPPIDNTTGAVVWAADSQTLFYTTLDDNHRPDCVWRQRLGTASAELVYTENDPGFFVSIDQTQSGRFVLINCHDHQTSEVHFINAQQPEQSPQCIARRRTGIEYSVDEDVAGERWVIMTNADGAQDFKLVTAPITQPTPEHWQDLLPHRAGHLLLGHIEYADYRVRIERVAALPKLIVTRKADGHEQTLEFADAAYALGIAPGLEYATQTLQFDYATPAKPDETWHYNMATGERQLQKRRQIPSGFDSELYQVERCYAPAADGQQIPITLLYKKTTKLDGSAPCLLYGYGAYGISEAADFSSNCLSLVDRGFVYAVAHIRGGKECGFNWYAQGRREYKTNTFKDFIAVAEYLIAHNYSQPQRLAAMGGSAGGMLIGAVINQRPDLFAAAVADVPFVDVLNTMLDDSLPLTPPEWPEWGNPIQSQTDFERIRAYCPYQNVQSQDYPALLVLAGLSDPRVTYWEPAKWVAKLRASKTDQNQLLLKTNMTAGHGGVSGRLAALKEAAFIDAFLIQALLMAEDDMPSIPKHNN